MICGWLGHFKEWEHFSNNWAKCLSSDRAIKYFSHHEAMGFSGQFTGWTEADRDSKLIALAQVIRKRKLEPLAGVMLLPQFKAIFNESLVPKKALRKIIRYTEPYHHCFNMIVALTLGHSVVTNKCTDKVDFVFDRQDGLLKECRKYYPKAISALPAAAQAAAGTVIEGNDKEIVALQAADFLSGQCLLGIKTNSLPMPLSQIVKSRKILYARCNPDGNTDSQLRNTIWSINQVWALNQKIKNVKQKTSGKLPK
jgi:hypothetical protein